MKHIRRYVFILALPHVLFLALRGQAQQTPYVVGSAVSGTVICGDSGAPARFAKVLLESTEPSHAGEDLMKNMMENIQKMAAKGGGDTAVGANALSNGKPLTDDKKQAMAAATKGMDRALDMMNASTVGIDGKFSFSGVKPGTYYVHAIYPGYIDAYSQFSDDDLASTDPAIRARVAQIPTVTVSGADSAHADVHLDRGAAISGRIVYDDGSPASGWTVAVVSPKPQDAAAALASAAMNPALAMGGAIEIFKTDDEGHYRVSGIAAGQYLVSATLMATPIGINATNLMEGGGNISLAVFSGDTFSQASAKSISLTVGEEHAGVDITIPARSLRSIVGHVIAKSDGHTLNMGMVSLAAKDNPAIHRSAAIRDDGSFHFEYLPAGSTYTIKVVEAAEGKITPGASNFMGMNIPKQDVQHKYGTDTADVMLGATDMDDVHLTVTQTDWTPPAKKPGDTDISPADLLKGITGAMTGGTGDSNDAPKQ